MVALASEQLGLEPTEREPRDIDDEDPSKGVAAATGTLEERGLPVTDENVFIVSALKDKGIAFLEGDRPDGVRKVVAETAVAAKTPTAMKVVLNGVGYDVHLGDPGRATVNGKSYSYTVGELAEETRAEAAAGGSRAHTVAAELSGQVLRTVASEGDRVAEGDVLVVLEALKMEIEVKAPQSGIVTAVLCSANDTVAVGDPLVEIADERAR